MRTRKLYRMDDALAAARVVVHELVPAALWAMLAGSVLTAQRTAGSDLDIVVCLPDDPGLPYRRSVRRHGWHVDLFVHDRPSLGYYLGKDVAARRPALHRMLATGHVVAGDAAAAAHVRDRCAAFLAEGPARLDGAELDRLRYGLTDLLDDLAHSRDPAETAVIAATAWISAAELALHASRHWLGRGKWLLRELRDLDPGLAGRWLAAQRDPIAIATFANDVLDRIGGPLFDGYQTAGERPHNLLVE